MANRESFNSIKLTQLASKVNYNAQEVVNFLNSNQLKFIINDISRRQISYPLGCLNKEWPKLQNQLKIVLKFR